MLGFCSLQQNRGADLAMVVLDMIEARVPSWKIPRAGKATIQLERTGKPLTIGMYPVRCQTSKHHMTLNYGL